MTPSPPKTFLAVTTTSSSSSISSSSSSSSSTNITSSLSSSSSSSSEPAFSATLSPFPPLVHALFGLGDLTDGLSGILWGDLTSDTSLLGPSIAEPTAATPTKTTLSSEDAPDPSTGEATADASSTKAAAASTAPVSLSTASTTTLATTTFTTTSTTTTTTPLASPLSSPLPPSPSPSTTGHEALVAFASSAPSTSASSSNSTGGSGGLRPGDLAGITIAAHVVLTVFIGLGLWHYRRKYRQLRDKEQQRERQSQTAAELAGSAAYEDDDDTDMMASRKTASSSTILEMKRLRAAGGGGQAASKSSLSALELLEPGNSSGLMSGGRRGYGEVGGGGGGGRRDHKGAAVPLTPSSTIAPDESPIIRPPSPLRLKGSDLRRKKPNLHMNDIPNEFHHAASTTAINKNNHLFQGEDDDDDDGDGDDNDNDVDDDDTSSSFYHYAEVTDDAPGGFGGPTRSPLLHLPNLSFHTLDLMADRPAVKAVKRYSVASPIRSPVPPGGFSAPESVYSGRGSVRFPLVASVAGSVVGRKSDEEEGEDEDDEAEDGASHDGSRRGEGGGETHDNDAGGRDKSQGAGAVRGGLRTPGGAQSPKSPPKIFLYPKPYRGW